ncbi:MAG: PfkB family carbohydrate kinase [Verrucomicrobiales bacterium]
MENFTSKTLIVGSVALDDIENSQAAKTQLLGGSASYASLAASFFAPTRMVGIVGDDFPQEHLDLFAERGVQLDGLQKVVGKTFAWSGVYSENMNDRETRWVELNVFADFRPDLPQDWMQTEIVLLANIAPQLQLHVLSQVQKPVFVIADTMDLWIATAKDELLEVIKRVDLLVLNDGEARQLTGLHNLLSAGEAIRDLGPRFVIIKKGEHGAILLGHNETFVLPAFPLSEVHDPTGAGDCFVGAFAGYLAKAGGVPSTETLRSAAIAGTVLASFNVEDFSVERLRKLDKEQLEERLQTFRHMTSWPA